MSRSDVARGPRGPETAPHAAVIPPSGRQCEIACDGQRAVVVEVGGGLRRYSIDGREVLDGYGRDEMCSAGRGQLLIPWPNRVQDGRYSFAGRHHRLALTEPGQMNAIHGLVRWASWTVAELEPDRVAMEYRLHPQPGYPFTVALRAEYTLSIGGLRVTTTAHNVGPRSCPFGAGAHPYLIAGTDSVDDAILCVPAHTVFRNGDRGIPTGADPVEGTDYDFRRSRPIGPTKLDHCFTDLDRDPDGRARVCVGRPDGSSGATLWMDSSYPYVMLFTGDSLPDINRRSIAVEPMTCPPNALRTGTAVVTLEPGTQLVSEWGITPQAACTT